MQQRIKGSLNCFFLLPDIQIHANHSHTQNIAATRFPSLLIWRKISKINSEFKFITIVVDMPRDLYFVLKVKMNQCRPIIL